MAEEEDIEPRSQSTSMYTITYHGCSVLDRRYTQLMLPWVMREVCRRNEPQVINFEITTDGLVRGFRVPEKPGAKPLFDHQLTSITRFVKNTLDNKLFGYLERPSPEVTFTCHVFEGSTLDMIQRLMTDVQEGAKIINDNETALNTNSSDSNLSREFLNFPVMYTGKLRVAAKKAPPEIIDTAVLTFQHSQSSYGRSQSSDSLSNGDGEDGGVEGRQQGDSPSNGESADRPRSNSVDSACSQDGIQMSIKDNLQGYDSDCSTYEIKCVNKTRPSAVPAGGAAPDPTPPPPPALSSGGRQLKFNILETSSQNPHLSRPLLFQIGRVDISAYTSDANTQVLHKRFKDISFCSQGTSYPNHFGYICREADGHVLYVFQCHNDRVVDDILATLKQAFNSAFQNKKYIVCPNCPMNQLHRLCMEIEGKNGDDSNKLILKWIQRLSDTEQTSIMEQLTAESTDIVGQNDLLMMMIRMISEEHQRGHFHGNERVKHLTSPQGGATATINNMKQSKFEFFRTKAKRSLTNSFESLEGLLSRRTRHRSGSQIETLNNEDRRLSGTNSLGVEMHGSAPTSPNHTQRASYPPNPFGEETTGSNRHGSSPPTVRRQRSNTIARIPSSTPTHEDRPPASPRTPTDRGNYATFQIGSYSPCTPATFASFENTQPKLPWRQEIFNKVVTPLKPDAYKKAVHGVIDKGKGACDRRGSSNNLRLGKRSKADLKALWCRAIREQILLIRMEKENRKLEAHQDAVAIKRKKLEFEELTFCLTAASDAWDEMLLRTDSWQSRIEPNIVTSSVKNGVPRTKRDEVWCLLLYQTSLNNPVKDCRALDTSPYDHLRQQPSQHQHTILLDLGRTFPSHSYFSQELGPGQLSLFNILKAYSALDPEVGYCQGLSFVAGVLIMYAEEEIAFRLLKGLMFQLGLRRQYKPDMVELQIKMYQLSRLLHDCHRPIYEHFELHDVTAALYAAPWFLTLFASQYPLGFVSRVFDLVFLQGPDVIMKIALSLLGSRREQILRCDCLESIVDYIKTTLPATGLIEMEKAINEAFEMDISKQLHAYEVEYHIFQEEMVQSPLAKSDEITIRNLKRQNMELVEKLQIAHYTITSQDETITELRQHELKSARQNAVLGKERDVLFGAVNKLRYMMSDDATIDSELKAILELATASCETVCSPPTVNGERAGKRIHNNDLTQNCT